MTNKALYFEVWVPQAQYENYRVFTDTRFKTKYDFIVSKMEKHNSNNNQYQLNWKSQRFGTFNFRYDLSKYNVIMLKDIRYNVSERDKHYICKINKFEYNSADKTTNQTIYYEIDDFYKLTTETINNLTGKMIRTNLSKWTYEVVSQNIEYDIKPYINNSEPIEVNKYIQEEIQVLDTYTDKDYVFKINDNTQEIELIEKTPNLSVIDILRKPMNISNNLLGKIKNISVNRINGFEWKNLFIMSLKKYNEIKNNNSYRQELIDSRKIEDKMLLWTYELLPDLQTDYVNVVKKIVLNTTENNGGGSHITIYYDSIEKFEIHTEDKILNYTDKINQYFYTNKTEANRATKPSLIETGHSTSFLKGYMNKNTETYENNADKLKQLISENIVNFNSTLEEKDLIDIYRAKTINSLVESVKKVIYTKIEKELMNMNNLPEYSINVNLKYNPKIYLSSQFSSYQIISNNTLITLDLSHEFNNLNKFSRTDYLAKPERERTNYELGKFKYLEYELADAGYAILKYEDKKINQVSKYLKNDAIASNNYKEYIKQNPNSYNFDKNTLFLNKERAEEDRRMSIIKGVFSLATSGVSGLAGTFNNGINGLGFFNAGANIINSGFNLSTSIIGANRQVQDAERAIQGFNAKLDDMKLQNTLSQNSVGMEDYFINENKGIRLIKWTLDKVGIKNLNHYLNKYGWSINTDCYKGDIGNSINWKYSYIQMLTDNIPNMSNESNSYLKELFNTGIWIINREDFDLTEKEFDKPWDFAYRYAPSNRQDLE